MNRQIRWVYSFSDRDSLCPGVINAFWWLAKSDLKPIIRSFGARQKEKQAAGQFSAANRGEEGHLNYYPFVVVWVAGLLRFYH